jgi:glucose-6-phosphate isomerase
MENKNIKISLGKYEIDVENALSKYKIENVAQRIYEKDYTVWSDKPDEVTNRLDWLISPQETLSHLEEIMEFVEDIKSAGFTHALLLGMGGSSLAPEVFRLSFGVKDGFLDLEVLDSTDPGAVLKYANKLDPAKTLYIVSTKSGGTIETLSFFKYFFTHCTNTLGDKAGKHFVAITDPGSKLEEMATELNFRKIFVNNPNIGGRYSVLSFFGTVPAALVGVDLEKLLNNASAIAEESKNAKSPSGDIGVIMAVLSQLGRDKLTFVYSKKVESFGTWVEQLIAESTGKDGVGILPVEGESLESPEFYNNDRVFIYSHFNNENEHAMRIEALKAAGHPVIEIILDDVYDLSNEFFRWEFATAVSGWKLGIQPFDQPNVESAKIEAKAMINSYFEKGELPKLEAAIDEDGIKLYGNTQETKLADAVDKFLSLLDNKTEYNYVAVMAYVTPTKEIIEPLCELRTRIQKKYKTAVTVGYGPRFLHSTGQLHKGDAGKGLFIQFTESISENANIPKEPGSSESNFTFGTLKTAQLLGDRQALLNNNRKVITIDLGDNTMKNLKELIKLM